MMIIAVLGTGHMGAPIARRLLAAGHRVTVWNRTAGRTAPLVAAGAHPAATPAGAVTGAGVVITALTDAGAVDTVLFGTGGAAPALRPGTCVVQLSTVGPDQVRDLARRLPTGVDLIDAPVGGSADAAAAGALTVLAAGRAEVIERVVPVLAELGTIRRCGDLGRGAALKLVLNTALVTAVAALADALAVADAVGVDRDTALAAIGAGPLGAAVARGTSSSASFSLSLAGKDLDLALAELAGTPAPVAQAAARRLRAAPDQTADLAVLVGKETR